MWHQGPCIHEVSHASFFVYQEMPFGEEEEIVKYIRKTENVF